MYRGPDCDLLYWFFGTELGCSIRATGANEHMARAQGINTDVSKGAGPDDLQRPGCSVRRTAHAQYQGFCRHQHGPRRHRHRTGCRHHRRGYFWTRSSATSAFSLLSRGIRLHHLLSGDSGCDAGWALYTDLPEAADRSGGGCFPGNSRPGRARYFSGKSAQKRRRRVQHNAGSTDHVIKTFNAGTVNEKTAP